MARHTSDSTCPLCEQKLEQAHETIRHWWHLIKARFPDCHVSCTYRGKDDQELAFKMGNSRLHYPDSMHNKTDENGKPESRAIDFFQIRPDKVPSWRMEYFRAIADFLKAEGAPIVWGGDWKKFKDGPHFELTKDTA